MNWPVLRIRDVYPGSWFLPIPDPGSKNSNNRGRGEKISCHTFFCSHKFHKIELLIFEMLKKKIWANFQRIIELFTQKLVTMLSKKRVWDLGSVIRDPRYGIRKKTYYGTRISDPQHWYWPALSNIGLTDRKYEPWWFNTVLDRCSSWCPFASSVHPPGNKTRRWRKDINIQLLLITSSLSVIRTVESPK